MKRINWEKLIAAVAVCQAAGLIGTVFTVSAMPSWYASLNKPWFNPPAWVFGPVWTLLYTLMGISLYRVWIKGLKHRRIKEAITLFLLQLLLNAGWSIIFFGFHNLGGALIEIVILWLVISEVMLVFYRIDKLAGKLLWPYLAWVSFAGVLTYSVWKLN